MFKKTVTEEHTIAGAVLALVLNEQNAVLRNAIGKRNPFNSCNSFRINSNAERSIPVKSNGKGKPNLIPTFSFSTHTHDLSTSEHLIRLQRIGSQFNIKIDDGEWKECSVTQSQNERDDRFSLKLNWEGRILNLSAVISDDHVAIFGDVSNTHHSNQSKNIFKFHEFQNGKTDFTLHRSDFLEKNEGGTNVDDSRVKSPMTGVYDKILVKVNDEVDVDTPVAVIIAMKMEYVLKAPRKGVVVNVNSKIGQNVAKGEVIVTIE